MYLPWMCILICLKENNEIVRTFLNLNVVFRGLFLSPIIKTTVICLVQFGSYIKIKLQKLLIHDSNYNTYNVLR